MVEPIDNREIMRAEVEKYRIELINLIAKLDGNILKRKTKSKPQDNKTQLALERTALALKRLEEFNFLIFGEIQCPKCWCLQGRNVALRTSRFLFASQGTDIHTCPVCAYELELASSF